MGTQGYSHRRDHLYDFLELPRYSLRSSHSKWVHGREDLGLESYSIDRNQLSDDRCCPLKAGLRSNQGSLALNHTHLPWFPKQKPPTFAWPDPADFTDALFGALRAYGGWEISVLLIKAFIRANS